jgi:hypothetical protein
VKDLITPKNIIVLGAGASFGSSHIQPESPPLGNHLFHKLKHLYPRTWGALPPDFAAVFEEDFELGMLKVLDSGNHWLTPLMQSMTLFFASFVPDRTSNDLYSLLISKLKQNGSLSNVVFSSLNYECTLELAASQLGIRVSYFGDISDSNTITVWKIHGSCNFQPDPKQISMRRSASYNWGMSINARLIPIEPYDAAQWVMGDTALYPAMCMFTLNKPAQISPHFFKEYQKKWSDAVMASPKIVTIGVRPHTTDGHIWGPIAKSKANHYFVGARTDFDKWIPNRSGGDSIFISDTFESAIIRVVEILQV